MPFNYQASGAGWRLCRSLITLAEEIKVAYPSATCLGTIGNAAHQEEGYGSDHNPFIKDPSTGVGIVRAIDIGGDNGMLQQIRAHIWALYAARDPRMYEYGYGKGTSDNQINGWGLPFSHHTDTGDAGHLHISVTQANGIHPSPSGYVSSIDSVAGWGFAAGPTPPPAPPAANWPNYPFSPPDHFGDILGDKHSHGGNPKYDSPVIIADIAALQTKLNKLGFGPLVADGQFGPKTIAAAAAFQHKYRANSTTLFGQIWGDDWATLRSL